MELKRLMIFLGLALIFTADLFAEEEEATSRMTANQIQEVIKKKFRKPGGSQVRIALLPPVADEVFKNDEIVFIGIEKALARIDNFMARRVHYPLLKVELNQLKRTAAKAKADVLLVPSFRDNRWSLLLYDKRSPYQMVMHSEPLTELFKKNPSDLAKTNLARSLVTGIFEKYAMNESYDLPQDEGKPLLQNEIPRWMASSSLMRSINVEIKNRWYLSASIGGISANGFEGRGTNSGMLAIQVGVKPALNGFFSHTAFEIAGQFFTYNAFLGNLKYYFYSKHTTERFSVGLGAATLTTRKTLAKETTGGGLGNTSNYAVPSLAMVVPVGELLFKIEGQYFTSIDERSNKIYSMMMGLFLPF